MGLEWHDRRRDKYGRFAAVTPPAPIQLHIRITETRAELVRRAALAARQDMGRYVATAIDARLTVDGYLSGEGTAAAEPSTSGCAPPRGGAGAQGAGEQPAT